MLSSQVEQPERPAWRRVATCQYGTQDGAELPEVRQRAADTVSSTDIMPVPSEFVLLLAVHFSVI